MDDYGMTGAVAGLFGLYTIIVLVVVVIYIVSLWMLFEKAGKPGWAAIIPVYNVIVLLEIVGLQWYWIFIFLAGIIPVIGNLIILAFWFYLSYLVALSYGKDIGFAVGLFLVGFVFYPMLAFNKDTKYLGPSVNPDNPFKPINPGEQEGNAE